LGAVEWSTDIAGLLRRATVIIAAASTPEPTFSLKACRDDAIICDAGYPKNIAGVPGQRLFWGGMGTIDRGFRSRDGNLERFYRFPAANAAHGCILEGAVLTLSGRLESFSSGRGRIKPDRIEDMWRLASGQGVRLAPLFNGAGLWPEELVAA
jgi:predicted amino acid dehydrogenase